MATAKKVPLRMCVACQEMKPKKELVRLVKDKDSHLFIDLTGKKDGRGAYICKNAGCFEKARKTRKFERIFSQLINDDFYDSLAKQLEVCK